MRIRDILDAKGYEVVTITPDRTVHEAMQKLVEHGIGALVVVEEQEGAETVGIISERDVLRLGAEGADRLPATRVAEAMTGEEELVVGVLDDDLGYVMEIMTENRVRHLPIVDAGKLRGIVSIGDVVNASRQNMKAENRYLRDYIQGRAR